MGAFNSMYIVEEGKGGGRWYPPHHNLLNISVSILMWIIHNPNEDCSHFCIYLVSEMCLYPLVDRVHEIWYFIMSMTHDISCTYLILYNILPSGGSWSMTSIFIVKPSLWVWTCPSPIFWGNLPFVVNNFLLKSNLHETFSGWKSRTNDTSTSSFPLACIRK